MVDLIDIRTAHAAQAQPYAPGEALGRSPSAMTRRPPAPNCARTNLPPS